jgi:predicted DNA binding CopG/RHH family protein
VKKKAKRNKPVVIRLSIEERHLAEKEAEKVGLSVSAYFRMLLHKETEK